MRYRNVISMHVTNKMQAFGWAPIVAGFSLLVVLLVGYVVGTQGPEASAGMYRGMAWNGAIFALLGPMIGYGFTSMGQYFPLALGLGLTRREYAVGVSIVFLGNALAYATIITVGKLLEVATNGFGLRVRFFDVVYTGTGPAWTTFVQTFLLILAVLFLGAAMTAAFLRLGQPFLWALGGLGALIGVGILTGIVLLDGFGQALLDLFTMEWGWWMVLTAAVGLLAAAAWALLVRRTQVR